MLHGLKSCSTSSLPRLLSQFRTPVGVKLGVDCYFSLPSLFSREDCRLASTCLLFYKRHRHYGPSPDLSYHLGFSDRSVVAHKTNWRQRRQGAFFRDIVAFGASWSSPASCNLPVCSLHSSWSPLAAVLLLFRTACSISNLYFACGSELKRLPVIF